MADISQTNWTEIDATNNYAAPLGWKPGAMLPTQVEPTAQMMMGAIKRFWNRINPTIAAATTATDIYTATPTIAITSLSLFEEWNLRFSGPNIGTSPSLVISVAPSTVIKKNVNGIVTALAAGDIQGRAHNVFWDGTQMILKNPNTLPGEVTGPGSSVAHNLVSFADTSGVVLEDSSLPKAKIVLAPTSLTAVVGHYAILTNTSGTGIGDGGAMVSVAASTGTFVSGGPAFLVGTKYGTTGGTACIGNDSRLTNQNLPYLSVQLNNTQLVTSSTQVRINYDTVNEDSGSYWDAGNFRFTPGIAGLYAVTVAVQGTGTTVSTVIANIYKNGTQLPFQLLNGGLSGTVAMVTFFVRLNGSTDYIEGWGNVTAVSGTAFDTGPGTPATPTTMTIHRIGA